MKKWNTGILAIGLLLASHSFAQKADMDMRENLNFGLRAGANYSNVWDEEGQDFTANPKLGFAGGAFLQIPVGKYLGVQPEVLLSQKGFQGSGTMMGTNYSFSRTTTYIDVPLQLQFKPIPYLTILAGPQYSFLLAQEDRYTFGANFEEQRQEFENEDLRRNILGVGLGVDVNISHLVLSARGSWDVLTNHGDGTASTPRYKNSLVQFTVGYRF